MASTFNKNLKITLFGESHGEAIGVTIDGIAPGIKLDLDFINAELDKRKAKGSISTKRHEKDEFKIISGFYNGYTTGTPLTFLIENQDKDSSKYSKFASTPRPSHADYTGTLKYLGYQDYRGGGHFSGRITAPIVIVGAICKQILSKKHIKIASHIKKLYNILDKDVESFSELEKMNNEYFPVLSNDKKEEMLELLEKVRLDNDSVGGILETYVEGIEGGIGEPFFDSIESMISSLVFSVPAVKGVSFGKGFGFAELLGSSANDPFTYENNKVITKTNNNGGINGGISNGMPIIVNTVIKATPSIYQTQETVNLETKENTTLNIEGRHDPCIIHRARVVVESMIAIALVDLHVSRYGYLWMK